MGRFDFSVPMFPGMTKLDRNAFQRTLPVLAARVPALRINDFKKADAMKGGIFEFPGFKSVESDPNDPTLRLVLLSRSEDRLSDGMKEYLSTHAQGLTSFDIKLDYDYWTAGEIMHSVLPPELGGDGVPKSFTQTGHIGHVNLREEYLPYKYLLGEILLSKNRNMRTIVNKVDTIDTEFRVFKMEVIAGEQDFNVVLNESDCQFAFDFSKVYWNSRLQGEHKRLIDSFKPGDVVIDVFAGVGPFAVPSAKKGCYVLGNDLNPDSASAMQANAERNKVQERLRISNKDGRDFIRQSVIEIWDQPFPHSVPLSHKQREKQRRIARGLAPAPPLESPLPRRRVDHFVMNLPATAIEFLDAFRAILKPLRDHNLKEFEEIYGDRMPMIHCHSFSKAESAEYFTDLRQRAEKYLGGPLGKDFEEVEYYHVRDVAPNKQMYCLSFRLPKAIALG